MNQGTDEDSPRQTAKFTRLKTAGMTVLMAVGVLAASLFLLYAKNVPVENISQVLRRSTGWVAAQLSGPGAALEGDYLDFLTYYVVANTAEVPQGGIIPAADLMKYALLREMVLSAPIDPERMPRAREARDAVLAFCELSAQYWVEYEKYLQSQSGQTGQRLLHAAVSQEAGAGATAFGTVGGSIGGGIAAVPGGVAAPAGIAVGGAIGAPIGYVFGMVYAWREYGAALTEQHAALFVPISAQYRQQRETLLARLLSISQSTGGVLGKRDVAAFIEALEARHIDTVQEMADRFTDFYVFQIAAARALVDRGRFEEAERFARRAPLHRFLPISERNGILFTCGICALHQDKAQDALDSFAKARETSHAGPESYEMLGHRALALCSLPGYGPEEQEGVERCLELMDEDLKNRVADGESVERDRWLIELVRLCDLARQEGIAPREFDARFGAFRDAAGPVLATDRGPVFASLLRRLPPVQRTPMLRESLALNVALEFEPDPGWNDYYLVNKGPLPLPRGVEVTLKVQFSEERTETASRILEEPLPPGEALFIKEYRDKGAEGQHITVEVVSGFDRASAAWENWSLDEPRSERVGS